MPIAKKNAYKLFLIKESWCWWTEHLHCLKM